MIFPTRPQGRQGGVPSRRAPTADWLCARPAATLQQLTWVPPRPVGHGEWGTSSVQSQGQPVAGAGAEVQVADLCCDLGTEERRQERT